MKKFSEEWFDSFEELGFPKDGYWWEYDDDAMEVVFGRGREIIMNGSMYEVFGNMSRKTMRKLMKEVLSCDWLEFHKTSPIIDVLKDENDTPIEVII